MSPTLTAAKDSPLQSPLAAYEMDEDIYDVAEPDLLNKDATYNNGSLPATMKDKPQPVLPTTEDEETMYDATVAEEENLYDTTLECLPSESIASMPGERQSATEPYEEDVYEEDIGTLRPRACPPADVCASSDVYDACEPDEGSGKVVPDLNVSRIVGDDTTSASIRDTTFVKGTVAENEAPTDEALYEDGNLNNSTTSGYGNGTRPVQGSVPEIEAEFDDGSYDDDEWDD